VLACVPLLQEWQAEVAAMLARAEQLKVLLAHRQAHHLSLLAAVLQHMHQQEVQQYDMPHSRSSSPSKRPHTPAVSLVQHEAGSVLVRSQQVHQQQEVVAGGLAAVVRQQLQQQQAQLVSAQAALQTEFHSVCWDEASPDLEEDEFFLPVGLWQCKGFNQACCTFAPGSCGRASCCCWVHVSLHPIVALMYQQRHDVCISCCAMCMRTNCISFVAHHTRVSFQSIQLFTCAAGGTPDGRQP
jgi:hypothetical protein